MNQCKTCGGCFGVHRGWCTPEERGDNDAAVTHTYDDLFPTDWEGAPNPAYMRECSLCGAAVCNQATHIEWHNAQEGKA